MAVPKRARSLAEVDDAVAGLAKAVERHSRMITAGRGETARLAAGVDKLSAALRAASSAWSATARPQDQTEETTPGVDQPAGETGEAGAGESSEDGLPSWLVTTDWHLGQELTTELLGWVRQVYLRWPDAVLPACWSLHPWVVEELWVLRCCWVTTRTGETASWLRWQDWHDRQRPATARRITEGLQECSPEEHVPTTGGPYPMVAGVDVVAIALTAWATNDHHTWPPTVRADLLAEPERTHPRKRPQNGASAAWAVPHRTLTPPGPDGPSAGHTEPAQP